MKCSELASNLGGHTHMKHFIFLQKRRPYIGLEDHFTLIKFCSLIECLSCTKATGVENRPPARVRANTKIALRGKSHQFPAQRPNLSIRDLNNRKMARQSFLRFLEQLNGGRNCETFITVQPLSSPNPRLASWTDFNARRLQNLRHLNLLHAISKSDLNVKNIPQLPQIEPIQPIMAKKGTQLSIYLSCAFEM